MKGNDVTFHLFQNIKKVDFEKTSGCVLLNQFFFGSLLFRNICFFGAISLKTAGFGAL